MTPETTETARTKPLGTDEEQDWGSFRNYLHELTPEGLWDAYIHVDEDRFPRRRDAVEREMARRGLFFVSPYTEGEQKVRLLHINLMVFSFLAVVIHQIPTGAALINSAALTLNNNRPILSPTGEAVSLTSGFTARETAVLTGLTYLLGGTATLLYVIGIALLPFLFMRSRRRALRPDLLKLSLVSLLIGAGLLTAVWW